jgi:hypothetical protein
MSVNDNAARPDSPRGREASPFDGDHLRWLATSGREQLRLMPPNLMYRNFNLR